jgi:hypothetical protein
MGYFEAKKRSRKFHAWAPLRGDLQSLDHETQKRKIWLKIIKCIYKIFIDIFFSHSKIQEALNFFV